MNDRPTRDELLEIQQHFGLPNPSLVEKDWYVVQALSAIVAADTGAFRLVFGGGTALSRAHGLIRRMSEDIDLKIICDRKPSRAALRGLRDIITKALLEIGFVFDPQNPEHRHSMYGNSYTRYWLPYAPIVKGKGVLRPEIQIETSVWPMRRPAAELPVRSFIAEGFGRPAEVPGIACAAISETAAEKLVALTRRAGSELAGLRKVRDPTLVRHIYDLHVIRAHYDVGDVAGLAREIMVDESQERARDFAAYAADPQAESLKAIAGIAASSDFAKDYTAFLRDMVYGDAPDFSTAVATLNLLAEHLAR